MSSTLNKRVKEMSSIDQLSELPESIIIHILSFLKVDESMITAVLSRRWQYLWTQSPKLYFRQGNLLVPDFVTRVYRTLSTRGSDYLESFLVDFEYSKRCDSDVNAWVKISVSKKVKKVDFLLNTLGSQQSDFYVLPQLMCSNSSLVSLRIKGCYISPQRTIDWPCLSELYIEGVEVQQQLIGKILSGCPVLSDLTLKQCWGFSSLEIKSKVVKRIWIRDHDCEDKNGPLLEISASYIKSLKVLLRYPEWRKLRLTNIPSDVSATIEFVRCDIESVEVMNNAKEILGNIQHVKEVKLGVNYLEVFSYMVIKNGYQFPQSTSRTSLKVNTDKNELSDIHGILGLLQSSPNLQKLFIKGGNYQPEPYNITCADGDLQCDLLHLKTVVIKDLVAPNLAGEPMLALVRILLKRTPILEKIVIHDKEIINSASSPDDPSTILKTLLSYPRSSQKASIIIR